MKFSVNPEKTFFISLILLMIGFILELGLLPVFLCVSLALFFHIVTMKN